LTSRTYLSILLFNCNKEEPLEASGDMFENILVFAIVALAVFFLGRRIYRGMTCKELPCGCDPGAKCPGHNDYGQEGASCSGGNTMLHPEKKG
jgi:hypothetical protein